QQDHYQSHRYAGIDPTIDWMTAHAPSGHQVGIGGRGLPGALAPFALLPFAGPRFGNTIHLIGPVDRDLKRFPRDRAEFTGEVTSRRYDTLLILRVPGRTRPEQSWAQALGYRTVAQSPSAVLMQRG